MQKKILKKNSNSFNNNELEKFCSSIQSKTIFCKNDKKYYSVAQILSSQSTHLNEKMFENIEHNGKKKLMCINLKFRKDHGFQCYIMNVPIDLVSIEVQMEIQIETESMPYKGLSQYRNQKGILAQIHKFEIPQIGCEFRLIHKPNLKNK